MCETGPSLLNALGPVKLRDVDRKTTHEHIIRARDEATSPEASWEARTAQLSRQGQPRGGHFTRPSVGLMDPYKRTFCLSR